MHGALSAAITAQISGNVVFITHFNIAQNPADPVLVSCAFSGNTHSRTATGQLQVRPPIARIEAPVARMRLVAMRVAHEILRRVQLVTRVALHASRVRARVHVHV